MCIRDSGVIARLGGGLVDYDRVIACLMHRLAHDDRAILCDLRYLVHHHGVIACLAHGLSHDDGLINRRTGVLGIARRNCQQVGDNLTCLLYTSRCV